MQKGTINDVESERGEYKIEEREWMVELNWWCYD
jgi:hypothetical protein